MSAVVAGVSIPKFTSTSATIEELDGHKMMTSGVPASLECRLASALPVPTSFKEQALTTTSGVPPSLGSRVASAVPINLHVAQLDVVQVLKHIVTQHLASNHNWLPCLSRGVDPSKDLSWMVSGFDLSTKAYPVGDDLDFSPGPAIVDLATELLAALLSIDRSQLSPSFNVILSCFQDPYTCILSQGAKSCHCGSRQRSKSPSVLGSR